MLSSVFSYLISESAGGIFLTVYPILAYIFFFITGRKYWKAANFKGNKMTLVFLTGSLLVVAALMAHGLKEDTLSLESETVVFKGSYGRSILVWGDLKCLS